MAGSPPGRRAIGRVLRSRTGLAALAVSMAAATSWSGAATPGMAGPPIARAQEGVGAVTVSPPATPMAVTVNPHALGQLPRAATVPEGEPLPTQPPSPMAPLADPVAQLAHAAREATAAPSGFISDPVVNFAGMTSPSPSPDVTGAVGRSHFVQMLNLTRFQVWDKQGNSLAGPSSFGDLWPGGSICRSNTGDPIVVYDHLADRWLLSQFANPHHMCVAISQTPDPAAGTWFLYTFDTGTFPDYPKFGVWPDGYYMSSYETPDLGVYAFDRANMLLGNAASFIKTTISALTPAPGVRDTRILPANLAGPPPPNGTPNFFVRTVDDLQDTVTPTDRIEIYEARTDWTIPTFDFVLVNTLTPAEFAIMACDRNGGGVRDCIPQPNIAATVDALSNRPMMQLNYRTFGSSQALVFNQTVNVAGSVAASLPFAPAREVAGIRWYELEKSGPDWTILQQGTYAPQPSTATAESQLLHRWVASAAMDKGGNIALGYNITNSDDTSPIFPSIRYTGRRFDDPLGLMPQGEKVILDGTGSAGVNGQFGQRWGDYSQMSVDPVDDCTFWYNQMVASGATQIASFRFDTCGADLAIRKSASPSPVTAGGPLTYTITVANNGPSDATNVKVVDTLPPGTTFVASTGLCVPSFRRLTCRLGAIAAGDTASFTVRVSVAANLVSTGGGRATVTNTATVTADQFDPDSSNNTASVSTAIRLRAQADLLLTKLCKPDPAGGSATCTILLDNLGPSAARNVVVTDTNLGNGSFTISSATAGGGACTIAGGVVTCTLGSVPAGGRVTITVRITSSNQVDDVATVTSSTPDPNPGNNSAAGSPQCGSGDRGDGRRRGRHPDCEVLRQPRGSVPAPDSRPGRPGKRG